MPLLQLNHVQRTYNANSAHPVTALKDINFTVENGEYVAIMGESGTGKSTLLNIIATLEQATGGQAILNGQDLGALTKDEAARYRREHLGFIFQHFNLLDNLSNRDNIYLPLVLAKTDPTVMERRLAPLMKRLRIAKIIDRFPSEVSGGQQQRVAIARALASETPVILADEPTGNLDEDTAQDITEILKESAHKMNKCVVVVTHSNELAKQADVVFRLKKGELQVLERVQDGAAQPQSRRNNAPRSERRAH